MSPNELFIYADRFARGQEAAGNGTVYPTLRQAAKRFKVAQDCITDACADYEGDGYLGIAVGFQTGAGWGEFNKRGDCLVEAYI